MFLAVFSVFFPPLFFFEDRQKHKFRVRYNTHTLNAHKNGGYKRKNFSREREEMNASSSVVLSSFSFFSVSVSF